MIVATNHVGDPGVHIIDGDREVVENTAVDAGDHRVVEMGVVGANLAQDHVVYDGLARVGHAQPDGTFVLGRSRSVSSMRSTRVAPAWRAVSQLYSAVRAPPMCRAPVGEGAKRTRMSPRGC